MSTASKLEEAEHKVQALQTGLASLFWPIPLLRLEVRGQRSLAESGLCVIQLLQAQRDPTELERAWWIRASLGLHTLSEHLGCSQSVGKHSGQGQARSTYRTRTTQQLKQAMELCIHVVFCSGFTHFWTMINIYSGLSSVWAQFPPVFLACSCDLLAINTSVHLCSFIYSSLGYICFCFLWEHKKCYSLNYCNKYFKWISNLASLIRNE